jgi:hypothetical protein
MEFTSAVVDNVTYPGYSEWVLQGVSDTLVTITQASDASLNIGSDSIIDNRPLFNDKVSGLTNNSFILQKQSVLNPVYMFDPSFENCPIDGGPLGTWIPANDPVQLGQYGYSRVQGGNGWATSGKKCMYLRFLGDATSYNSISQKLFSLTPGATYRLDLQYKVQSTSATALVNIYAATTANAATTSAIGGIYITTFAAASNLATQAAQSTSLTFVAPASSLYIVYSKNTTSTNYNFFIDNLILTETKASAIDVVSANSTLKAYVVDNKIRVDFEATRSSKVVFSIYNIQGQLISEQQSICMQGMNHLAFDKVIPSGVYFVKMALDGHISTTKIIK